jgi:2-phospho-L-lactate/phosphoenolpyruvate guanylyltransferase
VPGAADRWCLVVPVKRLAAAKTRLGPPFDASRGALALAFALDTTVAALACPDVLAVVVVTDDPTAAQRLAAVGAEVVGDEPDAGLNPALEHGAAVARRSYPACGAGALSADLPALRADELAAALTAAGAHRRSFVRDAEGSGTTLVLARPDERLQPAFGPSSAARHAAAGYVELAGEGLASVRQDVDTVADMERARGIGVGPHTRALLLDIQ